MAGILILLGIYRYESNFGSTTVEMGHGFSQAAY
jgi:hypothetical protein